MTVQQVMAALHWPGWAEIGEPDIAARIAEYGADFEVWPCDEWDWMKRLPLRTIHGDVRDFGPVSRQW